MGKSKALPSEVLAHVASYVERIIARDFPVRANGTKVSERKMAEAMGLTQPVLNDLRHKKGSLGIHAVLALRAYTGDPIDVILGFSAPQGGDPSPTGRLEELERKLDEVLQAVHSQGGKSPGPRSKTAKIREAVERARLREVGQRHLDDRAQRAAPAAPVARKEPA